MSSSKRKLLISSLVLIFIIISVAGMVSAVFALTYQTTKTPLSLYFESTADVYAEISGGVFIDGTKQEDSNIDMSIDGDGETGSFSLSSIVIDEDQAEKNVNIDLNIKNTLQETQNSHLYVSPSLTQTNCTNMQCLRLVSFGDDNNYEVFTENNICVMAEQTAYFRFQFIVIDPAYQAEFNGEIDVNLYSYSSRPTDASTSTIAGVGEYPQTRIESGENSIEETLSYYLATSSLETTGKTYTVDIGGTKTTLIEYIYEGKKYARLTSAQPYAYASNLKFSNGDTVYNGASYFFYVQPIKVTAVESRTVKGETKTIWLTKALMSGCTMESEWVNQTTSGVRYYLNETFLDESGISAIEMTIKNDTNSGNSTSQADTTDTLWLPSRTEIMNWYTTNTMRKAKPTDLALATHTDYSADYDSGFYYTRSYNTYESVNLNGNPYIGVSKDGGVYGYGAFNSHFGIRFAFAM